LPSALITVTSATSEVASRSTCLGSTQIGSASPKTA